MVYYDAFESPDAMEGAEDPAGPPPAPPLRDDEELGTLRQRTRQLEARRGRITAKKVYLKNKKVIGERAFLPRTLKPPRSRHPVLLPLGTGNLHLQS